MLEQTHCHGIAERAHAPEIGHLLERYISYAVDGIGAPYAAFNLAALDQYRDNLMVLAPDGTGDFAYLHYGRDISKASGFDQTGRRVGDSAPDQVIFGIEDCHRAVAKGHVIYTVQRTSLSQGASVWESLLMPVISEAGDQYLLVFSKPIEFREQLLATILDSSTDGVFAFTAIRDTSGAITDAFITTANRRGAEIIGKALRSLINKPALATLPILTENYLWERCLSVMESREADRFETAYTIGLREYWFQIALTALDDGLVMTLTDVTDLKMANLALQSRAASLAIEIGRERASIQALSSEINARERREVELRKMAETDPLTGLLNRRTFEAGANEKIGTAHLRRTALSMLVVDLDHFKSVNDSYGHSAGDAVIKAAADKFGQSVRRDSDLVGRMGGEEFALCLPRAETAHAARIAESLRAALAATPVATPCGKIIRVTASFGIATLLPGETLEQVLERADRALYAAKRDGRNCVSFDTSDLAQARLA